MFQPSPPCLRENSRHGAHTMTPLASLPTHRSSRTYLTLNPRRGELSSHPFPRSFGKVQQNIEIPLL